MPQQDISDIAIYVHIPFCHKKCPYCDFYSVEHAEELYAPYVESLRRHFLILQETAKFTCSSIYIGGGTPTVLDPASLHHLLDFLNGTIEDTAKAVEWTIEVNPESLTDEKIEIIRQYRINRLSIGTQAFDQKKCSFLWRIHTVEDNYRCIQRARASGLENISIDLIYGIASETLSDWKEELAQAVCVPGITHISVYALACEKNTPFYQMHQVQPVLADEEVQAQMYQWAMDYLPQKGFIHYEVSNFAGKGYFCRHNMAYWDNRQYIGLGTSAVSYIDGVRFRCKASIENYIQAIMEEKRIPIEYSEKLDPLASAKETAALQMRRMEGIYFKVFQQKTGVDIQAIKAQAFKQLMAEGLVQGRYSDSGEWEGVFPTKKGFLFCDTICSEILST